MAKTKTGPSTGITEEGLRWAEIDYNGVTYRVRQLVVDEADAAFDASLNPDKVTVNNRLRNRIELVTAIVSPPSPATTLDDIGKWPNAKLYALLRLTDGLDALPPASAEGEDSAPAT